MILKSFIILIAFLGGSFVSHAQTPNCFGSENSQLNTFLDFSLSGPSLSDQEIESIWLAIQESYADDFAKMNLNLKRVEVNSNEIGAWADKKDSSAIIMISKANRFHRKMNLATMTLVMCHELGHFLGGTPRYSNSDWSSVEGQADYFATSSCVPAVYKKISNQMPAAFVSTQESQNYCRSLFSGFVSETCAYAIDGAYSLIQLLSSYHPTESFKVSSIQMRDFSITNKLIESHASLSCRYETFLRGVFQLERPSCWLPTSM